MVGDPVGPHAGDLTERNRVTGNPLCDGAQCRIGQHGMPGQPGGIGRAVAPSGQLSDESIVRR